jgi:hypothetical protein
MILESGDKLKRVKEVIGSKSNFKKFKFNNEIYSVGDDIQIHDDTNECLVAKIVKILTFNGSSKYPYWPTIEVQWYYRKTDIIKDVKFINKFKIDCISNYELFNSNHKDTIFIETIIGKCTVLTLDEYELLDEVNGNIYYTRAFYDPIKVSYVVIN